MEILQKTKSRVAIWSSNPTSLHILRQNNKSKRYKHLYVHSSTIYNRQDMETTTMFTNRWTNKEDVEYTHMHTHTHTQESYSPMEENDEWIKMWNTHTGILLTYGRCGIHTHREILLTYGRKWNNAICSNMNGPRAYHTRQSQKTNTT